MIFVQRVKYFFEPNKEEVRDLEMCHPLRQCTYPFCFTTLSYVSGTTDNAWFIFTQSVFDQPSRSKGETTQVSYLACCAYVFLQKLLRPANAPPTPFSCYANIRRGLREPSLTRPGLVLYMSNPVALRKQTEPNLKKPVGELCSDGDVLAVTEKYWHDRSLSVVVRFNKT